MFKACWLKWTDETAFKEFKSRRRNDLATDKDGNLVFMAESAWALKMAQENHPEIQFSFQNES